MCWKPTKPRKLASQDAMGFSLLDRIVKSSRCFIVIIVRDAARPCRVVSWNGTKLWYGDGVSSSLSLVLAQFGSVQGLGKVLRIHASWELDEPLVQTEHLAQILTHILHPGLGQKEQEVEQGQQSRV